MFADLHSKLKLNTSTNLQMTKKQNQMQNAAMSSRFNDFSAFKSSVDQKDPSVYKTMLNKEPAKIDIKIKSTQTLCAEKANLEKSYSKHSSNSPSTTKCPDASHSQAAKVLQDKFRRKRSEKKATLLPSINS